MVSCKAQERTSLIFDFLFISLQFIFQWLFWFRTITQHSLRSRVVYADKQYRIRQASTVPFPSEARRRTDTPKDTYCCSTNTNTLIECSCLFMSIQLCFVSVEQYKESNKLSYIVSHWTYDGVTFVFSRRIDNGLLWCWRPYSRVVK